MTNTPHILDVLIIGGGVVGCAVLREVSRYAVHVALCEAEGDVGAGISRANTAIAHTGFDAPPGTLEAQLVTRSHQVFAKLCAELEVDTRPCGALMLAFDAADIARLGEYQRKAATHGVLVEWVERAALLAERPYLNPQVQAGLRIPGEMPVDSFRLTLAYAESAVRAGAEIWLDERVEAIEQQNTTLLVRTSRREIQARFVVNAAGMAAAQMANMLGDTSFTIRPRKGQLIVVDPADAPPIDTILLPTPSPTTKGILITPAAHGNLLLGPTAEDGTDPSDWATTDTGLAQVMAGVQRLVPELRVTQPITSYAGLRSVGYEWDGQAYVPAQDYIVRTATNCQRMLHVAGIRSTGLSASPMLAVHVVEQLVGMGLELSAAMPSPSRNAKTQGRKDAKTQIRANVLDLEPLDTQVICPCAQVTAAQVRDAIHGPVPAYTLDALKRRLWVMAGPCQGARCIADLVLLLAKEHACDVSEVRKHAIGSEVVLNQELRTREQENKNQELPRGHPNQEQENKARDVSIAPSHAFEERCAALLAQIGETELTRGNLGIPGTRPAGILTAGGALRLLAATGRVPGLRAVIVGQAQWLPDLTELLELAGMSVVVVLPEIAEIIGWLRVAAVRKLDGSQVVCDLVILT